MRPQGRPNVPTPGSRLRAGMSLAEMSMAALWSDYFALGGMASPSQVRQIIQGDRRPSRHDYDLIAQAINESCLLQDADHPVPYAEDIGL